MYLTKYQKTFRDVKVHIPVILDHQISVPVHDKFRINDMQPPLIIGTAIDNV